MPSSTPDPHKVRQAVHLLQSFRVGDRVLVKLDSDREQAMIVSRGISRSDGQFGSYESSHIRVSYGWGRYATEVHAEWLALGKQSIAHAGVNTDATRAAAIAELNGPVGDDRIKTLVEMLPAEAATADRRRAIAESVALTEVVGPSSRDYGTLMDACRYWRTGNPGDLAEYLHSVTPADTKWRLARLADHAAAIADFISRSSVDLLDNGRTVDTWRRYAAGLRPPEDPAEKRAEYPRTLTHSVAAWPSLQPNHRHPMTRSVERRWRNAAHTIS